VKPYHEPASALPWMVVENKYGKRAVVSQPRQKAAGDNATMWTGRIFVCPKSENRAKDALFAMHASNAYPELVSLALDLHMFFAEGSPISPGALVGESDEPVAARLEALLRRIGEIKGGR